MNQHWSFVDDSCLYVEGQIASAVQRGLGANADEVRALCRRDWDFAIDFSALFTIVGATRGRAWLVGSRTERNTVIWPHVLRAGFSVLTVPRAEGHKEKEVDAELMLTALERTAELGPGDRITLVTGDRDFAPLVRRWRARGITVRILFWRHATSGVLIREASEFRALDVSLAALRLRRVA